MKLYKKNGEYVIEKPSLALADEMLLENGEALEISLKILDARAMTDEQRKFIFKLCSIFEEETGINREKFRLDVMHSLNTVYGEQLQSLTEYTVSDAKRLIDLIVLFMIEKEIRFDNDLIQQHKFKFNYNHTYHMCLKRVCVVCGRRAELHHVDHVGMGQNRNKISHIGKKMLPLCRTHHNQVHTIGEKEFIEKYHLIPIEIDEKLEYFIKKGILKVTE